ncbi:hypothetical protein EAG_13997 [Camponotus floridanus]|uniref:Uncharacterized protein n=1 Tax=Camponotus floridanus TaxID=104421 RepID=E2A3I1_CAMFO|nr:hypothetical protein EAG_13997 [Camponotus floridanus]
MPGPRADQYFGSGTRRGGRGRERPSAAEGDRTLPSATERGRAPARGEPSFPPRAALPAQSLRRSGRRGMCGIVIASVTEE